MPWDHAHYETAHAVFLTSGADDSPPPVAVFQDREEADAYIAWRKEKEADERNADAAGTAEPMVTREDVFPEAGTFEVRNAFLPWWNDYRDAPDEKPEPLPDYERNELLALADKYDKVQMTDLLRELAGFVGPKVLARLSEPERNLLDEIARSKRPTLQFDDGN